MEVILSQVLANKNNLKIRNEFPFLSIEMIEKIKKADKKQKNEINNKTIWERRMNDKIKEIDTYFYIDNKKIVYTPEYKSKNPNIVLEYTLEE